MLFSAAVTEYMEDKGKRLRATTLEGYASAIRCHLMPQWGGREIGLHVTTPSGLKSLAKVSTKLNGNDGVQRIVTAKAVFAGVEAGKTYYFKTESNPNAGWAKSTPFSWLLEVRPY